MTLHTYTHTRTLNWLFSFPQLNCFHAAFGVVVPHRTSKQWTDLPHGLNGVPSHMMVLARAVRGKRREQDDAKHKEDACDGQAVGGNSRPAKQAPSGHRFAPKKPRDFRAQF